VRISIGNNLQIEAATSQRQIVVEFKHGSRRRGSFPVLHVKPKGKFIAQPLIIRLPPKRHAHLYVTSDFDGDSPDITHSQLHVEHLRLRYKDDDCLKAQNSQQEL
jgi:hypothetical protein